MFIKKPLLFCFLLFACSFQINAQNVKQVIAKYIEFIGGKEQWKNVKSIITRGSYEYNFMKFPFTTFSKAPDLYKFVVPFNAKYYMQGFDGKRGWKIDAFNNETEPVFLTGEPALTMANEADVELESPLIDYKKKGHKAILMGKDTIENKICFAIKFIRKTGVTGTYFIDSKNFELVMKRAPAKNPELKNAMLDTFYHDYREVDGVKIPFKSNSKIDNQTVLIISIEKAEINVPIPDSNFQPGM